MKNNINLCFCYRWHSIRTEEFSKNRKEKFLSMYPHIFLKTPGVDVYDDAAYVHKILLKHFREFL